MAFIQCPECGKEINNAVGQCPDCGYLIKKKNPVNKKLAVILIASAIVTILCVICVVKLVSNNGGPAKQAIKIIEEDYGKSVDIKAIYYNEEQEGCVIEFTCDGMSDIACIDLEEKSIGYESVFLKMGEKMNDTSLSDEERQTYAVRIIEYPYDAIWVYGVIANGTSGKAWKKVQ